MFAVFKVKTTKNTHKFNVHVTLQKMCVCAGVCKPVSNKAQATLFSI